MLLLTHWGWVTDIYVSNLGPPLVQIMACHLFGTKPLSEQMPNGPLRTNFSEILIKIQAFSLKKMHLNISSVKWRPFCLSFNVFNPFSKVWKRIPSGSTQSASCSGQFPVRPNPSGGALALTLVCYAPCDRTPPQMHPLKMFEILGHPHFKQLHGHKIPMHATNSLDGLDFYVFTSSLSFHSFVSVHDIQQKDFWIKLVVTLLLIPTAITVLPMWRFCGVHTWWMCHLSITRDIIRGHVNHMITIMTLNSFIEFRNLYCPEQCIFIVTTHIVKDAVAEVLG